MKVLIADDEYLVRSSLLSMLKELEMKLDIRLDIIGEATNGEEAVELIKRYKPDLAFIDIRMPKLNGLEAIKAAKSYSSNTQWIILTGFSEFDYAKEAIKLGASDYLLKPASPEELEEILTGFAQRNSKNNEAQNKEESTTRDISNQVMAIVERDYMQEISIGQIAEQLNMTPNYLSTIFHKKTGMTFIKYLTKVRMIKASELLEKPNAQVQKVAEKVGYYSTRHFTKLFKEYFGFYPSEYRDRFIQ